VDYKREELGCQLRKSSICAPSVFAKIPSCPRREADERRIRDTRRSSRITTTGTQKEGAGSSAVLTPGKRRDKMDA